MDKYINVAELLANLKERYDFLSKEYSIYDPYVQGIEECIDTIEEFNTVDIKPVIYGNWIKTPRTHLVPTGEMSIDEHGNIYAKREHKTIFRYRCSCCGLTEDIESDFCPNCGADTHKGEFEE